MSSRTNIPTWVWKGEVYHHTQILAKLIQEGRIRPTKEVKERVTVSRFLLPGPLQRRVRCAPVHSPVDPRHRAGGNGAQPRKRHVLRRRWRHDVDGGKGGRKGQHGPDETGSCRPSQPDRQRLPLLPDHDERRHQAMEVEDQVKTMDVAEVLEMAVDFDDQAEQAEGVH